MTEYVAPSLIECTASSVLLGAVRLDSGDFDEVRPFDKSEYPLTVVNVNGEIYLVAGNIGSPEYEGEDWHTGESYRITYIDELFIHLGTGKSAGVRKAYEEEKEILGVGYAAMRFAETAHEHYKNYMHLRIQEVFGEGGVDLVPGKYIIEPDTVWVSGSLQKAIDIISRRQPTLL